MIGGITDGTLAGDGSIWLDRTVLEWFVGLREPWLTTVMRVTTVLGSSAFVIPLVLVAGLWCWRRHGSPRPLALLGAAYGGAFVLSHGIKALTDRPRPPAPLAIGHFSSSAFPSGHATQAAAVYGMLAVVLAATGSGRKRKVALGAGAVLIVVLVDVTRLYLGAHWLTDVVAGDVLGALWTRLVLAASQQMVRRAPAELSG